FTWYLEPTDLHSFPTRRSSDLSCTVVARQADFVIVSKLSWKPQTTKPMCVCCRAGVIAPNRSDVVLPELALPFRIGTRNVHRCHYGSKPPAHRIYGLRNIRCGTRLALHDAIVGPCWHQPMVLNTLYIQ